MQVQHKWREKEKVIRGTTKIFQKREIIFLLFEDGLSLRIGRSQEIFHVSRLTGLREEFK